MGKQSKKKNRSKKFLADKVAARKKDKNEKTNPFEMRFNRKKHQVLGKTMKHERGMPGVSRSKALQKRKDSLLKEYKTLNRANKFIDRRIGEYDPNMNPEEKIVARFAAERKSKHKTDIFNLNEEEELTHYGQSLSEIEKFDDPRSDDDDEVDNPVGEFMKESHFGGLLVKKETDGKEEQPKSRKEWIDELITLSKQRKHDRQTEKDETEELTVKLNEQWAEVRNLLSVGGSSNTRFENPPEPERNLEPNSYDVLVRTLKFTPRAKSSSRLKTVDEVAAEEKEKLEQMELERNKRMKGVDVENDERKVKKQRGHQSADALDDNLAIDSDCEEERFVLKYDMEAKLRTQPERKPKTVFGSTRDDEAFVDDDDEEVSKEGDDGFSDLESDGEDGENKTDDGDEKDYVIYDSVKGKTVKKNRKADGDKAPILKTQSTTMASIGDDLPYTFAAPSTFEEFQKLVFNRTPVEQSIIVDRIIKCNHPSLLEGNKEKLETFFAILLQHLNDVASDESPNVDVIDKLIPHLSTLANLSRNNAGRCFHDVIVEKQEDFRKACREKLIGVHGKTPEFDTLVFLRIVSLMFSTSDFRHPVVTPAILFMGQILSQCPPKTRRDLAVGCFVCSLFLEYVSYSKRYVPEVMNYVAGCLFLVGEHDFVGGDKFVPPSMLLAPPFDRFMKPILMLENDVDFSSSSTADDGEKKGEHKLELKELFTSEELTDEFRIKITVNLCKLLKEFTILYKDYQSLPDVLKVIQPWWKKMKVPKYPAELKETLDFLDDLISAKRCLKPLMREKKKPKSIVFVEPAFVDRLTTSVLRKKGLSGPANETQKLKHKVKMETKAVMREIRRDNLFLAKQKLDERIERDNERKRKVKALFNSLQGQESDFKQLIWEKDGKKKKRK